MADSDSDPRGLAAEGGGAPTGGDGFVLGAEPGALDLLLREPGELLAGFDGPGRPRGLSQIVLLALGGHLVYGLVMASFAGGMQWWAVPLKVLVAAATCAAICFPSLYILVCLSGARARVPQVASMLASLVALSAVFLAGAAPIVWVFSQSSNLTSFMGAVHLLAWLVSMAAAARILTRGLRHWRARHPEWGGLWLMIFVVTSLQMATVLRPMVGPASGLLEPERRFFLQHWLSTISQDVHASGD